MRLQDIESPCLCLVLQRREQRIETGSGRTEVKQWRS